MKATDLGGGSVIATRLRSRNNNAVEVVGVYSGRELPKGRSHSSPQPQDKRCPGWGVSHTAALGSLGGGEQQGGCGPAALVLPCVTEGRQSSPCGPLTFL